MTEVPPRLKAAFADRYRIEHEIGRGGMALVFLAEDRNDVRSTWAQIDVQLKRGHDLVPNLVEVVKGYAAHEREVLQQVTEARARAVAAGGDLLERLGAEALLTMGLRSLFGLVESYPALKASQSLLRLQEELTSTENRIAFARQHYNDSVRRFNTSRESFPRLSGVWSPRLQTRRAAEGGGGPRSPGAGDFRLMNRSLPTAEVNSEQPPLKGPPILPKPRS